MRFYTFVLKNVVRRRVRSSLTVIGMAVAVGAVVALVGISSGFERSFMAIYQRQKVDIIVQQRGVKQRLTSVLDAKLGDADRQNPRRQTGQLRPGRLHLDGRIGAGGRAGAGLGARLAADEGPGHPARRTPAYRRRQARRAAGRATGHQPGQKRRRQDDASSTTRRTPWRASSRAPPSTKTAAWWCCCRTCSGSWAARAR